MVFAITYPMFAVTITLWGVLVTIIITNGKLA